MATQKFSQQTWTQGERKKCTRVTQVNAQKLCKKCFIGK